MAEFGTPAYKLYRTGAGETSREAASGVNTTGLEWAVFSVVQSFPNGCIQDDVLEQLPHCPYSSVTARFRALLDKGLIYDTGHKRAGNSGRNQRIVKAYRGVYG